MENTFAIIIPIGSIISAIIAYKRGFGIGAAVIGLMTSIMSLPFFLLLTPAKRDCPFCFKRVDSRAIKCAYCHSGLIPIQRDKIYFYSGMILIFIGFPLLIALSSNKGIDENADQYKYEYTEDQKSTILNQITALKKDFHIEKNINYDFESYKYKHYTNTNRNTIQMLVTDNGGVFITCNYYGNQKINFNLLQIKINGMTQKFPLTNIKTQSELLNNGETRRWFSIYDKKIVYPIYTNYREKIDIRFAGNNGRIDFVLDKRDAEGISKSYALSELLQQKSEF